MVILSNGQRPKDLARNHANKAVVLLLENLPLEFFNMGQTFLLIFLELLNSLVSLLDNLVPFLDHLISLGDAALGVPLPKHKDSIFGRANGFLQGLYLPIQFSGILGQLEVLRADFVSKVGDLEICIVKAFRLDERFGLGRLCAKLEVEIFV